MREFLANMPWKGAALLVVKVLPDSPGFAAEVRLQVRWPDGAQGWVIFGDCSYLADLQAPIVEEQILAVNIAVKYIAARPELMLAHNLLPVNRFRLHTALRVMEIQASRLEINIS